MARSAARTGSSPTASPPSARSRNAWTTAALDRVSTFAADVDTAAYSFGRRYLTEGQLPMPGSVRVEEYVNYFTYSYAPPPRDQPFAVAMDLARRRSMRRTRCLRVGVSTRALAPAERKLAHLVFLVDVSGSMRGADRLELAKKSLRVLVESLQDGDTVAIVTYAGSTELVLPATGLDHKAAIVAAIDGLTSGAAPRWATACSSPMPRPRRAFAPARSVA